ncbi:MAG: hypothetical protein JWM47_3906 [Acidimicrobiales bacterium]|nr:hypothetical protein [Acidimicrobiales bacterium]
MDYETFVEQVARRAHLEGDGAEEAIRATLETLAVRLSKSALDQGRNRDLLRHLPIELAPWLLTDLVREAFDADEFLRRVGEREGVHLSTAELHARAVFSVLRDAIPPAEFDALVDDLPGDFRPIVLNLRVPTPDEVLDDVAEAAGVELDDARRMTEAVLETLAERIPPGQVDDLVAQLPIDLHGPLRRHRDEFLAMPADQFVRRVAEREGTAADQAVRHVRIVLSAVRDAAGIEEFSDVVVELPDDYDALLPARPGTESR